MTLLLRLSIGSVWIITALTVVFPYYQEIGAQYLSMLGAPTWIMYLTCLFELFLGVWVIRKTTYAGTLIQVSAILFFTLVLLVLNPMLAASPFGVLTKNIPMLAIIVALWLHTKEEWSPNVLWLIRSGVGVIWITEGLLPKVLFQQQIELDLVSRSWLVPMDPALFLTGLGMVQIISGIGVFLLRGKALTWLLGIQFVGIIILVVLASIQIPTLLVHPFGPIIKNLPILAGTYVVMQKCRS